MEPRMRYFRLPSQRLSHAVHGQGSEDFSDERESMLSDNETSIELILRVAQLPHSQTRRASFDTLGGYIENKAKDRT